MWYISLHKEIAVQNAFKYNFALLSLARFSEFDGENTIPIDTFPCHCMCVCVSNVNKDKDWSSKDQGRDLTNKDLYP